MRKQDKESPTTAAGTQNFQPGRFDGSGVADGREVAVTTSPTDGARVGVLENGWLFGVESGSVRAADLDAAGAVVLGPAALFPQGLSPARPRPIHTGDRYLLFTQTGPIGEYALELRILAP